MMHETAERILRDIKVERLHSQRAFIMHLILVGCVVFVFVLGLYFFFNRQVNLLLEQQSSFYLQEVAVKSAERLEEKMEGDLAKLKGMALALGSQENLDMDAWLAAIEDDPLFSEFQRIGYMLPDGQIFTSEVIGGDFSGRDYFQAVIQGKTVISDVFIDNIHQKPTLVYAVPIIQGQKVVAGIGVGMVVTEYEKYLPMPSFAGEGTMHLLDRDGSIILKLGEASIPKRLSLDTLREDFAERKSGIIHLDTQNNPRLLAYAPIGKQGWSLLLEIPRTFLEKTQKQTTLYSVVMTVIFGLLILIFPYTVLFRRRGFESSLLEVAYIDELTGAANHTLFVKGSEHLLREQGSSYACIVLNIHRFKLINDLFGFTYGDSLLKQIASMLPSFCSEHEIYGRSAGDRFLLLFKQGAVENRVQAMLATLNQIALPETSQIKLEIVAGIFILDKPHPINICIDRATLALDHLKGVHDTDYLVYNETIREQLLGESELVKGFQEALETRQFFIQLQPKFNMMNGKVVGSEALIRWNHPTKGLLSPLQFIPLFEEHNLISELDMFVLREVCGNLRMWQDRGLAVLPISVNQSRAHLDNPSYVTDLIHEVDLFGLDHSLLEFEMTESIFLRNLDHLTEVVSDLRKACFSLSIDDFGSGYSSLNMLKNITVDFIKLDREFLMKAEDNIRAQKVIQSVISMANDLGITVVAEGVETREQATMLMQMGCTIAQGYYYEKPISVEAYEKLLNPLQ